MRSSLVIGHWSLVILNIGHLQIMDVRTYRARSMQEALRLIRQDLGPDAAVLHTREVNAGVLGGIFGGRQIEVTASTEINVPSRLPEAMFSNVAVEASVTDAPDSPLEKNEFRSRLRENLDEEGPSLIDQLSHRQGSLKSQRTAAMFRLFTDLVDAGIPEAHGRELLDGIKRHVDPHEADDERALQSHVARLIEGQLRVRGPLRLARGRCNVVALVGPTGVGKTTTIAKLAANFRLQEKCRVGLITIDTYRIAAVEQLRTYAEIMDLPMEVVATADEMHGAIQRMAELDLVLIDTAGRSPRDETHLQELRAMLAEAQADEVHLVLSSVTSSAALQRSVDQFREAGATHVMLTKVDEAVNHGSLFPLLKRCELPITYITNGQSVPSDIFPAQRRWLARLMMGMTNDQ
jgi:flagellar biosynthesis protein FlhF